MIRSLSLAETLDLHRSVIERWGGASGIRDLKTRMELSLVSCIQLEIPDSTIRPSCFKYPVSPYHFTAQVDEQLSLILAQDSCLIY